MKKKLRFSFFLLFSTRDFRKARLVAKSILTLFLFFFDSPSNAQGFLVSYPTEPYSVASSNYTVYVNETQVFAGRVAYNNDVSYAHFGFAGKVTVRVRVSATVGTYNLSPHSYGISSTKSGQDITFDLDKPRKLLLNNVNSLLEHLCIIAEPLEDSPPKIGNVNVNSIMSHSGANNTGSSDNLTIIQNALNNLPSGSILYFPAGRYTAGGTISMVSNKSVYLAPGAVIQASSTGELSFNFDGASNVKLFGRGSIDGLGDSKRPGYNGEGGATLIAKGDVTISDNCTIDGIVLKGAITWTAIVMGTTNWKVYNLKVINGRKFPNHDSWDPHNAINMMVDNCFFYGTDDAIAFSVTRDNLDLNTTFRNSVLYNDFSGATLRVGPYMGKNTRHLNVENNDHLLSGHNEYALAFYIGNSDQSSNYIATPPVVVPGALSKVRYLNNRVENAHNGLLLMRTKWDDFYAGGNQNGSLDSIAFDHLTAEQVALGWEGHKSQLEGTSATNFVNGVYFKDFYEQGGLVTSNTVGDVNILGSFITNVTYRTSTTPVIGIIAPTFSATRGGPTPGIFRVTRTGGSTAVFLSVNYVIHGTAINGTDYITISSSVTIPAGATFADITITPSAIASSDNYRTVYLSIASKSNSYLLGPDYDAVVTVVNADD